MTDTDRLAALLADAARPLSVSEDGMVGIPSLTEMAARLIAAGVTLQPTAPAEGLDPGPPRGPDTTRDPRNPRKPAAPAEGLREAAQAVVDWFADVEGSRLDCLDALRAALKETDREPTGTVARGASPRGLPEHGVSDVPSGSRPPRPHT